MNRVLLALLGLILIAVLAFFCYQNKADTIKNDLVTSSNAALNASHVTGVNAAIKGDGLGMTDVMTLSGKVESEAHKQNAENVVRAVLGVGGVDNQIQVIQQVVEKSDDTKEQALVAATSESNQSDANVSLAQNQNENNASKIGAVDVTEKENSYTLAIQKDEKNRLSMDGSVNSEEKLTALLKHAYTLFGKENVTNKLTVRKGAPEDWEHISHFALDRLNDVDYGDMKLVDKSYEFTAHLPSPSRKADFLNGIRTVMSDPENKYGRYRGDYVITAPIEEPTISTKKEDTALPKVDNTTSTATKTPVDLCQEALSAVVKDKKVLFEYNKATLTKESLPLLDAMVVSVQKCKISSLMVAGHTDNVGPQAYNKNLSEQRAKRVVEYLVKKGIDAKKLSAIGHGETKPVATNKTKAGRAENRRIEFIVKEVK